MDEQVRCSLVPYLLGLSARHLAIAGQYFDELCGSPSGRVSVGFDCFPACFVSPAVSYPLLRRPVPSHQCRSHPISPACLLRSSPSVSSRLIPFSLIIVCPRPACFVSHRLPVPSHVLPVPPRGSSYPYRPHRFLSPPAVSVELDVFPKGIEFDAFKIVATERLLPTACLPSDGFRAALSLLNPIPSRGRPADGIAATIAPRQSPRPSCRGTGRMMRLDVIGCHAVDTVIYDSRGAFVPTVLARPFSSSHHLIIFLSLALPSLPSSLMPACSK